MNSQFIEYISNKIILLYVTVFLTCIILFPSHMMDIIWIVFGFLEVLLLFQFWKFYSKNWANVPGPVFKKNIFQNALIIRLLWVVFSYFFFLEMTGQAFEFQGADSLGYHNEAIWIKNLLIEGDLSPFINYRGEEYSDYGFPLLLGFIYYVFSNSVLLPRLLFAIIDAYSCVLVFKLSLRFFNEESAKLSSIIYMLFPLIIYYTGLHLKATVMIFIVLLIVDKISDVLLNHRFQFQNVLIALVFIFSLFFFRAVLGITMVASVIITLFFISKKFAFFSKRILLLTSIILLIIFIFNFGITHEIFTLIIDRTSNQIGRMILFAERTGGNAFATFGSTPIFLPIMLSAPFPSFVDTNQTNTVMLNGAYFVKGIISFFAIYSLFFIFIKREYKKYILPISILLIYVVILAMSGFALSMRFHLPIIPFIIIFAGYGLTTYRTIHLKYFNYYLYIYFAIVVFWNWFKLAGRGLI